MQSLFVILLVLVLAAAMISFVVLGWRQRRRTARLARAAHTLGLRFAPDDPLDVPVRYGGFALISAGHSPRAANVTFGRLEGCSVRAMDFRHELGHGTRRLTCHYSLVIVQADSPLPPVLLWHEQDMAAAPLPARAAPRRVLSWHCLGDEAAGAVMARACQELADRQVSVQTIGQVLLFAMPVRRKRQDYRHELTPVLAAAKQILAGRGETAPAKAD